MRIRRRMAAGLRKAGHCAWQPDRQNAEIGEDLCPTLSCIHEAPIITEPYYIVRRLTPTECARLQGFSDWWCSDLGTENPTESEIRFWADVFETHRKVVTGAKKPKTKNRSANGWRTLTPTAQSTACGGTALHYHVLTLSCLDRLAAGLDEIK